MCINDRDCKYCGTAYSALHALTETGHATRQ